MRRADTIERMLRNMFLGDPPGNYNRILDFSTAVTGSLYFVPTREFLAALPASTTAKSAPPASTPKSEKSDGSLGIGSLKRSTT